MLKLPKISIKWTVGILFVIIVMAALIAPAAATFASSGTHKGQHDKTHIVKSMPGSTAKKTSQKLGVAVNAPSLQTYLNQGESPKVTAKVTSSPQLSKRQVASVNGCVNPTIDMKVLVISADGTETDLLAITQALDYLGTPYTVYQAARTPNGLTSAMLMSGCHGSYQGVILTNGDLGYSNAGTWMSALSQQEWSNLWGYEAQLGIRELSWYTYPDANFGYQVPNGMVDTDAIPLQAQVTSQGHQVFSYINNNANVPIQYAYTYLAKPFTDGATVPVLQDAQGNSLAAVRSYPDGRQVLSMTFDSNLNLIHNIVLSYGLINWLTQSVFVGERHVYMSPQVDDVFIEASEWTPTTVCGTNPDATGSTYRINGNDWQAVINWQNSKRAQAISANTTLTMAFNGYGTTADAGYKNDTLTPSAKATQSQFYWVSHTYDHTNLDAVNYQDATFQITQNNQIAQGLGLTHYSAISMVTPDVSGLANPNYLQAAYDNGLRYLVSDTSKVGQDNPAPNIGMYNASQPSILEIPRRPVNLFYNVTSPAGWTSEYNCIYHNFWGRDLSYQEILDKESQTLVTYMLKGEMDPWMFHQTNLKAYDGQHTLLGDLMDATLQKYAAYYNLPVTNIEQDKLGMRMADRMQYKNANVTASIVPGVSITLTAQQAAKVPVSGLAASGSETYGGQSISYVSLNAGQSVTLPLH